MTTLLLAPVQLLAVADAACERGFLGLVPWYHYLDVKAPGCSIVNFHVLPVHDVGTDVPLVLAAIVDDLLRIAGLVAVAFVIVGAIQYMTSQGNPEGTARAQSTIVNALIGLAVSVVAVTFVSFVGSKLGG